MFCNENINWLGFGAMRLPCLEGGAIDEEQVQQMVDYALEHGINYFDTAYPYHGGRCEMMCPQKINISEVMHDFAEKYKTMPKWSQICKEREEANRKLREQSK